MIIVREVDDARSGHLVIGVAVTTTIKEPLHSDSIELPWHPAGKCSTGFRKRSIAVCSWVIEAAVDDLQMTSSFVPKRIFDHITAALAEIAKKLKQDKPNESR